MKLLLIFTFFLFIFSATFAQKELTVSGLICDKEAETPVEGATARILVVKDSSFISGGVSNGKGRFTVKGLCKGSYLLEVSFMGYKKHFQAVTLLGNEEDVPLGKIRLLIDDVKLDEVLITAKAAEMVMRGDTIEYNSGSYKLPENATVEELLKKLPGVEVDKDGKITVNGKEVKKLLVDGKEFFSNDPKLASQTLPARMVDKLQVLDKASEQSKLTGFDDGNKETVINLTVKEGMKVGLFGDASLGWGHDVKGGENRYEARAFANLMLNQNHYTVRVDATNASDFGMGGGGGGVNAVKNVSFNVNQELSKKLRLSADLSYDASDRLSTHKTTTETALTAENSLTEQTQAKNNDVSDNFRINAHIDWRPDTCNTLMVNTGMAYSKSRGHRTEEFASYKGIALDTLYNGNLASKSIRDNVNFRLDLIYAHQFKKKGRVFSTSVGANLSDDEGQESYHWKRRIYEQGVYNRDSLVNQRSERDGRNLGFQLSASYVEPIGKNNFLQLAYNLNRSDNRNVNSSYDMGQAPFPQDTAYLNALQSRSTLTNAVTQRISLNFRSVREKYDYSLGIGMDPSSSVNKTLQPYADAILPVFPEDPYQERLPNVMGDSLISKIEQQIINFSPIVSFNYRVGKTGHIRIYYNGNTSQPSARQLQDFTDVSNPMNSITGNPNLKPGYSNRISASFSKSIPKTQLFYNFNLNGGISMNDIASSTLINPETGYRSTTYKNLNGNWNVQVNGMVSTPLKNKKFSVGNSLMGMYRNNRNFTNQEVNTMRALSLTESPRMDYRSDLFSLGISASLNYMNAINELQPTRNQRTYHWGITGYTSWNLPADITVETVLNWSKRNGYSAGFNLSETMWNATVSKQLFNKKQGTGRIQFEIFDLLQQNKNISRYVGPDFVRDSESNRLSSYFMCSFIYNVNIFPNQK